MRNYNDFTASDIFSYDKNNNIIYTDDDGKKYIINDSKLKQELQNIEGYRSFIYPENKRRFISFLATMFISTILLLIYNTFINELNESIASLIVLGTYWSIHLYLPYIFHKKISDVLKKCNIVQTDKK